MDKRRANGDEHTFKKDYPFEVVVVTFPDEGAALVATEGPLRDLQNIYSDVKFLATCDPLGCRCGSGGGTLAALEQVQLLDRNNNNLQLKNILIMHAGGDSSRCFTQMALGKAWTNLPLVDDSTGEEIFSNPILLGMTSIARIFSQSHKLPQGSVVIAASDALLSIPHYKPTSEEDRAELGTSGHGDLPMPEVLGVAFPSPLETAKNHGVYVLLEPEEDAMPNDPASTRLLEVPIRKVLQKPSLQKLQEEPFVTFGNMKKSNGLAWIDNGIIAFLPRAAQALHNLASGILKTTTKAGLLADFEQRKASEPKLTYQDVTYKIDLYTHFLQALTIAGEPGQDMSLESHRQNYLKYHASDLDEVVAKGIFDALSPFQFQVLAIPEGKFLHLGTTRELKDFYVYGCMRGFGPSPEQKVPMEDSSSRRYELYTQNCTYFGQELGMIRRMEVVADWSSGKNAEADHIGKNCVLMGSVLKGDNSSEIGEASVVEFCCWDREATGSLKIGKNCLVSGLRKQNKSSIDIPDNSCVQMMPLLDDNGGKNPSYVYMALGVDDPIKNSVSESTFFGVQMESFLKWAGLSPDDIWDTCKSKTIWNARLHPKVSESSWSDFSDLWNWLNYLPGDNTSPVAETAQESLALWKSQIRLSLSQVRDLSDAAAEFRHRHKLVHDIIPDCRNQYSQHIAKLLWERANDECDFYPLLTDSLCAEKDVTGLTFVNTQGSQCLHTLDEVIKDALLDQSKYDVCGRALMVKSALLDDLASATSKGDVPGEKSALVSEIRERCASILKAMHSSVSSGKIRQQAFIEFTSLRQEYVRRGGGLPGTLRVVLKEFSELTEFMARIMTEICVSGFLHENTAIKSTAFRSNPVIDKWVIAASPARVDLSGGWSDTPPVCYEYGSLVTGIAVTVDGRKPLSCRCRIISSGISEQDDAESAVIFLRSEIRDSDTCGLTSAMDLQLRTLDDLRDARDPSAPCALIKCALICLGLIPLELLERDNTEIGSLQDYVNSFCQSKENVRMEIVVTSLLPQGSGMGTSSILGGCVLAAVGRCVGVEHSSVLANSGLHSGLEEKASGNDIIDSVSALEQILSTGGGFQDQVNGLIGGAKVVSSQANQLPIKLDIKQIEIDPDFQKRLDDSLLLVFTGKTRLAKNILQNVLRRWARRTPEVVCTVKGLVEGANRARDALQRGDLDELGECLNKYYAQKKHMAGEESGVEPESVRCILDMLKNEKLIRGAALCGAGGGGFLVMIAAPDVNHNKIHALVDQYLASNSDNNERFVWHDCKLSNDGLVTKILTNAEGAPPAAFDTAWHC